MGSYKRGSKSPNVNYKYSYLYLTYNSHVEVPMNFQVALNPTLSAFRWKSGLSWFSGKLRFQRILKDFSNQVSWR